MYEDLIKRLRSYNGWALNETLDQAADAIEELSVQIRNKNVMLAVAINERPQWVSVAERLPKEMVLAHGRDGDIRLLEYSFTKKWWEDDDGYYCDTNYVTHWMPLPEPPKEET